MTRQHADANGAVRFPKSMGMAEFRRRIFGISTPDDTPNSSRDASPDPKVHHEKGEDYKLVAATKLENLKKAKTRARGTKRRFAWVFGLGALLGLFAAAFFSDSTGLDHLVDLAGLTDLNLDSILDVLPAGLIKDVRDLQVCCQTSELGLRALTLG